MPGPSDDQWFGGKKGSSSKAHQRFIAQYGLAKGESYYHAYIQKRKALARARRRTGA